jgi:hypothetical protein
MKKVLAVVFTLIFFTLSLSCMENTEQYEFPLSKILNQILPHCDKNDVQALIPVNTEYKYLMVSEPGLAYAANKNDKALFRQLLSKQNREEQKDCYNFLLHMSYRLVILPDSKSVSEVLCEELRSTKKNITDFMSAYRYEVRYDHLIDKIKNALKQYDGTEGEYKRTIKKYAKVKKLQPSFQTSKGLISQNNAFVESPLGYAIFCKNKHSVQLLLEDTHSDALNYLDPTTKDELALKDTTLEVIQLVCKYPMNDVVLQRVMEWAVQHDNPEFVQKAIDRGVDVNASVLGVGIPLLYALEQNKVAVAKKLLSLENIDVNCSGSDKITPLHTIHRFLCYKEAKPEDYIALTKLLLAKNANIAAQESMNDDTPLHMLLQLTVYHKIVKKIESLKSIISLLKAQAPEEVYSIKNKNDKTIIDLEQDLQHLEELENRLTSSNTKTLNTIEKDINAFKKMPDKEKFELSPPSRALLTVCGMSFLCVLLSYYLHTYFLIF